MFYDSLAEVLPLSLSNLVHPKHERGRAVPAAVPQGGAVGGVEPLPIQELIATKALQNLPEVKITTYTKTTLCVAFEDRKETTG